MIAPALDYDREHIHRFPEIVEDLEKQGRESDRKRVVFFGNSLMMHGLHEDIVHRELASLGGSPIASAKITPVGTAMLDWVYLYRRYFESETSHPDVIVVGFVAHHIHDQEPVKLRRLSRHFVATPDLPDLWQTENMGFHNKAQSILCRFSALEGDQPEHQLGILQTLVADYKNGVNKNNQLVSEARQRRAERLTNLSNEPRETYRRMEMFLAKCKQHGVDVWLVPMPQPEVWDYNPAATEVAEKYGMKVLDARQIEGMAEKDFSDGYHLGETGGAKFSKWIARQIKETLSP